jgi:hypothetical protein
VLLSDLLCLIYVQNRFMQFPFPALSSTSGVTMPSTHKVPGPDNIIPRVLKELATHISPILTIIFRKSYNTGEIPSICKRAFVCPIPVWNLMFHLLLLLTDYDC